MRELLAVLLSITAGIFFLSVIGAAQSFIFNISLNSNSITVTEFPNPGSGTVGDYAISTVNFSVTGVSGSGNVTVFMWESAPAYKQYGIYLSPETHDTPKFGLVNPAYSDSFTLVIGKNLPDGTYKFPVCACQGEIIGSSKTCTTPLNWVCTDLEIVKGQVINVPAPPLPDLDFIRDRISSLIAGFFDWLRLLFTSGNGMRFIISASTSKPVINFSAIGTAPYDIITVDFAVSKISGNGTVEVFLDQSSQFYRNYSRYISSETGDNERLCRFSEDSVCSGDLQGTFNQCIANPNVACIGSFQVVFTNGMPNGIYDVPVCGCLNIAPSTACADPLVISCTAFKLEITR